MNFIEKETIDGFDIKKRELTEEEATRDITLERFQEFHGEAGEDFVDTNEHYGSPLIFGGYLIGKYPYLSKVILNQCNKALEWQREHDYPMGNQFLLKMYTCDPDFIVTSIEDNSSDAMNDVFYTDYAEFLNLTEVSKKRVNQILIQVKEHYSD